MSTNTEDDWISYISRGRLITPSVSLLNVANVMNVEFEKFHGAGTLQKGPWIFKTVTEKVLKRMMEKDIPSEVVSCLVRTRTYIRMRILNKNISTESSKLKTNKKLSIFTNKKVYKF